MRPLPAGAAATTIAGFDLVLELPSNETTTLVARKSGPHNFARWATIQYVGPFGPEDHRAAAAIARELKRAAYVSHPNVLPIHDLGIIGGAQYVVTDYIAGASLGTLIERSPLPASVAIGIALDVLAGLDAIHRARDGRMRELGLTHGALDRTCIIVGLDGCARIAGLGLAASTKRASSKEAAGRSVADDIFKVGVLLHEMLLGPQFRTAPIGEPFPLLSAVDSTIPRSLANSLARAVSPNPEFRFASADLFARALESDASAASSPRASSREIGAIVLERAGASIEEQKTLMQAWVSAHEPYELARGHRVLLRRRSRAFERIVARGFSPGVALIAASVALLAVVLVVRRPWRSPARASEARGAAASPPEAAATAASTPLASTLSATATIATTTTATTLSTGAVVDLAAEPASSAPSSSTARLPTQPPKARPRPWRPAEESLENPYR